MAEENVPNAGAIPPKQSPLSQPAGDGAAPKKPVIMRKPTLRRPGEAAAPSPATIPSAPIAPAPAAPAPIAPAPAAPVVAAPVAQGIEISRQDAAKKMTARINLASATAQIPPVVPPSTAPARPTVAAPLESKTIKLRPPTVAPDPAALQRPAAELQSQAAKSKTSRISLEAALSAQPELPPVAPDQPKTIRLKRPSDMNAPAKPTLKPPTTHVTIPPTPHQTGTIPPAAAPAPDEAPTVQASATRKMTIKVKRNGPAADGAPAESKGPKIKINKGESAATDNGIGDESLQALSGFDNLAPVAAPDKVNPVFMIAAVLAILVTINLIWVFTAQFFGPNSAASDFATLQGPDVGTPIGAMVVE